MRKNQRKEENGVDYWQPTADMMTCLVLVLLLLLMLLILYLMQKPADDAEVPLGETEIIYEAETDDDEGEDETEDGSNGGSNGGGGETETETEEEETETEWPEGDEMKAAVYVKIIDGETGQLIPEEGVTFELYEENKTLQILNTYYPEKISYRDYETTENGTFFLPEKIPQGYYYFRDLTTIEGYDLAADAHFELKEPYDWPDPYVVEIPMSPCKNIIRIQMKDADDGTTVPGGAFEVAAAEDIVTGDGTLRYKKGEIVGQITCNPDGYGESDELYLGDYIVRQTAIPEYYASLDGLINVSVEQKTDVEPELHEAACSRTTITLKLTDELYDTQPIAGAEYSISHDGAGNETFTTDVRGEIKIDSLEKDTEYHFAQVSSKDGYAITNDEIIVAVDKDGRINGEPSEEIYDTNRILRISISVKDKVLGGTVQGKSLALYTSGDEQVKIWTTSQAPMTLEGLDAGEYYLKFDGDEGTKYTFTLSDKKEMQEYAIKAWTAADAGTIAALAAAIAGIIAVAVLVLKKAKGGTGHGRKRNTDKAE